MWKRTLALSLTLFVVMAVAAAAGNGEDKGNQTKCPVMGNAINKEVYTDYKGHRIFFCCKGCVGTFMQDPEAHLAKMKAAGEEPMKLEPQSVCPVGGHELKNREVFVDYEGKRVYFCCPKCSETFAADPEKYLKVLADRGETPEEIPEGEGDK